MPSTKPSKHLPARRKEALASAVNAAGEVTVGQLADDFGVSVDTVRRDLDELAADGFVTRTHGGAIRKSVLSRAETPIAERMRVNGPAKRAIGRRAAELVQDGQTLLLNGGTTTLAVLEHLADRRDLTVVTNNLLVPAALPPGCASEVYMLGGNVRVGSQVTVGPVEFPGAEGGRSHRIQADVALISVGGVSGDMGYSTSNVHEARMMFKMMRSSRLVVLLADSTKFGKDVFAQVAELDAADVVVTDAPVPSRHAELLERAGIQVLVAGSDDALTPSGQTV